MVSSKLKRIFGWIFLVLGTGSIGISLFNPNPMIKKGLIEILTSLVISFSFWYLGYKWIRETSDKNKKLTRMDKIINGIMIAIIIIILVFFLWLFFL